MNNYNDKLKKKMEQELADIVRHRSTCQICHVGISETIEEIFKRKEIQIRNDFKRMGLIEGDEI